MPGFRSRSSGPTLSLRSSLLLFMTVPSEVETHASRVGLIEWSRRVPAPARSVDRQLDGRGEPATIAIGEGQLAAVCIRHGLSNAETEPCPAGLPIARRFAAVERAAHPLQLLRRQARAAVADSDGHGLFASAHLDLCRAGIFQRIVEKVADRAPQQVRLHLQKVRSIGTESDR